MARLLCVCFMMLLLTACVAGTSTKFQCGPYKVEHRSVNVVAITNPKGDVAVLQRPVAIHDMSTGDIRYFYSSFEYIYLDVIKRDNTHERTLSVPGFRIECNPTQ